MTQYTIPKIPEALDRELSERAKRKRMSLNDTVVEAIRRGLGVAKSDVVYDELDDLIGTWEQDDEFDRALSEQDSVDSDAWQ